MTKLKDPPTFNPEEGDDYANWKKDVSVWKLFSDDEKHKKQYGAAIYLVLQGSARDAVRAIKAEDLGKETGYDEIIKLLDSIFQKDDATQAYCAFRDFVQYKRSSGESFAVFSIEFERRYREVEKHKMTLPTGAKAYFLLEAANLTVDNERLDRATAKLDYDDMKRQIQKVFGDTLGEASDAPPVKTEEVMYTKYRGGARGKFNPWKRDQRQREGRIGNEDQSSSKNQLPSNNAERKRYNSNLIIDGVRLTCYVCKSIKHLASKCPHKEKKTEEVNTTSATAKVE